MHMRSFTVLKDVYFNHILSIHQPYISYFSAISQQCLCLQPELINLDLVFFTKDNKIVGQKAFSGFGKFCIQMGYKFLDFDFYLSNILFLLRSILTYNGELLCEEKIKNISILTFNILFLQKDINKMDLSSHWDNQFFPLRQDSSSVRNIFHFQTDHFIFEI